MSLCVCHAMQEIQRAEEGTGMPKPGVGVIMCILMCVLRTELRSSERTCSLNH